MMLKAFPLLFFYLLSSVFSLGAAPTGEREWTSKVGSKIVAVADKLEGQSVVLKTSDGRTIRVALSKLSDEDQKFLRSHFKPEAPKSQLPGDLVLPVGEFSGPIDAGGSSYYIYLPTTLHEGIKAPLVFWTGASPSNADAVTRFVAAAELTGVAVACSVESKNQTNAFAINHGHTKTCLKHIKRTLPVDVDRAIFTGGSGGGATAFYNAHLLKCVAALPYQGYIPQGSKINKKIFYQIGTGARDFNRYASAQAAQLAGEKGMHRVYKGGHASARPPEAFEGLLWVYTRHIYENPKKHSEEIALFEGRFLQWFEKLAETKPHRAYFWAEHLIGVCKIETALLPELQDWYDKLSQKEANKRYVEAYRAMAEFCVSVFSKEADTKKDSHMNHVTDEIVSAAKALEEQYSDVSEIKQIAVELGMPTGM